MPERRAPLPLNVANASQSISTEAMSAAYGAIMSCRIRAGLVIDDTVARDERHVWRLGSGASQVPWTSN